MPGDVVALVPAAGRGTRLGIDVPKVFADLGGARVWDVLLERLARVVSRVHLVLSPEGARCFQRLAAPLPAGVQVTVSVQPEPTGMGDAVFGAAQHFADAAHLLIVWGDQLGVSPSTLAATVRTQLAGRPPAISLPLLETERPYVDYRFDAGGTLREVRQSREGDPCGARGLADVGVFALAVPGLCAAWQRFLGTGDRRGACTGELNFLPFLAFLSSHEGFAVQRLEVTDPREARGLNTAEDLAFFRAQLRREP